MNILTPFLRQAAKGPDRTALVHDGGRLSYSQLRALAGIAAYWMREAGVKRGDCAVLVDATPAQYLVFMLAGAWLGCAVASIPLLEPEEVEHALKTAGATIAIAAGPIAAPGPLAQGQTFERFLRPLPEKAAPPAPAADVDEEVWAIFFSSGTTGRPKAIGWSHGRACLVALTLQGCYPGSPSERLYLGVGLAMQVGTSYALKALHTGGCLVIAAQDPASWLGQMHRFGVTMVLASTHSAMRLCSLVEASYPGASRVTPASLRVISCGGAPLDAAVHETLKRRFAPLVFNHFGASETGLVARSGKPGQPPVLGPWAEGQAVDDQGQPLPAGQDGRLRFRTPAMAKGYVGNPEATARHFENGWFYPGDLGSVSVEGRITLTGRADARINRGGIKADPEMIESVLRGVPGIEEAAALLGPAPGLAETIIALVVLKDGAALEGLAATITRTCEGKLWPSVTPRAFYVVTGLPRTSTGKLIRQGLPELIPSARLLA